MLGTWGTFIGIFAKGGEWWRRMRFGSRRSFVILLPKQNYPKSVIRVYGRLVFVMFHDVTWPRHRKLAFYALVFRNVSSRLAASLVNVAKSYVATEWEQRYFREQRKLACSAEP